MKFFHHRSDEKFKQSSFPAILLKRKDDIFLLYPHFLLLSLRVYKFLPLYSKIISPMT